jgi:hypothetical protein
VITYPRTIQEVKDLTEKLEAKKQQLTQQCDDLRNRVKAPPKIQHSYQTFNDFETAAIFISIDLNNIDLPIHQLRKPNLLENVKRYLKEAEAFLQRSQAFKEDPQIINNQENIDKITNCTDEIIKKYQPIAKRSLIYDYLDIFMQQSEKLPPTDKTSKALLNQLINRLIDLNERSSNDNALNRCLDFFKSKLNTDERFYIPQQIKFKMIEFYQKIEKIYSRQQPQYAESVLQNEIQDLEYETFPFFLKLK